jgi:fructose-specific phosphotransferase system IIC component
MNFLKMILQLILSCLFWVLIIYWLIFVIYTIMCFVRGGPVSVIAWYSHIATMQFHWNRRVFLADQIAILAITVTVFILRRRLRDWRVAR